MAVSGTGHQSCQEEPVIRWATASEIGEMLLWKPESTVVFVVVDGVVGCGWAVAEAGGVSTAVGVVAVCVAVDVRATERGVDERGAPVDDSETVLVGAAALTVGNVEGRVAAESRPEQPMARSSGSRTDTTSRVGPD